MNENEGKDVRDGAEGRKESWKWNEWEEGEEKTSLLKTSYAEVQAVRRIACMGILNVSPSTGTPEDGLVGIALRGDAASSLLFIIFLRSHISGTTEPIETISGIILGSGPGITATGQFRGFASPGAHRTQKSVGFRQKFVTSWRIACPHTQTTKYFQNLKQTC